MRQNPVEKLLSWRPFASKRRGSRRDMPAGGEGARRRPPVPRRERIIGALAGLNLVTLPWFVAGQPLWAQALSLALSAGAFAFLFLPVGFDAWRSKAPARAREAVMKSPPFWCGVVLLALLALQAMNPRLEVALDGGFWQLLPLDHVAWLPAGVSAPLRLNREPGGMNALREMMLFGAPWLMFTALWCGVRSRRVIAWLVRATLVSCVGLAVFSMSMRASEEPLLYNSIPVSVGSVYGPFLYQNQGGAFFYAAALLAAAMALRDRLLSGAEVLRGGRHFVFGAIACLLLIAAGFSSSFGAMAGAAAGIFAVILARWFSRHPGESGDEGMRRWIGAGIAAVMVAVMIAGFTFAADLTPVRNKFAHKIHQMQESKVDDRAGMRAATWAMYRESDPLFGAGGGSYRWLSPEYFVRLPEFRDATGRLSARANYAHFDWLQMLAEWGAVGLGAVLAAGAWLAVRLGRHRIWAKAAQWPLVAALVILPAHACMDYLFFNPAVSLLYAFIAFVALAWTREDGPAGV